MNWVVSNGQPCSVWFYFRSLLTLSACWVRNPTPVERLKLDHLETAWWNEALYKSETVNLSFHSQFECLVFNLLPGASAATVLGKGFLAVRKAGHLCVATESQSYSDYTGREKTMEVRVDVLKPGQSIQIVFHLHFVTPSFIILTKMLVGSILDCILNGTVQGCHQVVMTTIKHCWNSWTL